MLVGILLCLNCGVKLICTVSKSAAYITKTDHETGEVVEMSLDIREYVHLLGQIWSLNASLNV